MKKVLLVGAVLSAVGVVSAMDKTVLEKFGPSVMDKTAIYKTVIDGWDASLAKKRAPLFKKRYLSVLEGVPCLQFDKGDVKMVPRPISDSEYGQLVSRAKKLSADVEEKERELKDNKCDRYEVLKLEMALADAKIEFAKVAIERDIEEFFCKRGPFKDVVNEDEGNGSIRIDMEYLMDAVLKQLDLEEEIEKEKFSAVIKGIRGLQIDEWKVRITSYPISEEEFVALDKKLEKLDADVREKEGMLAGFSSGDGCEKLKLAKALVDAQIEQMKTAIERAIAEACCLKNSDENSMTFLIDIRMGPLMRYLRIVIARQLALERKLENAGKESK